VIQVIYDSKEAYLEAGCDPDRIVSVMSLEDGEWAETFFEMDAELADRMATARAEWKLLEEAGTPYWCVHKDRSVSHPAAYWQDDQPFGIHRKHGVICRDCGGYIQEG
jgi:hypothetical protein